MTKIYVVATDEQDSPVVIGPLTDGINDQLYCEIEGWGWKILSGYARSLTLNQARREAQRDRDERSEWVATIPGEPSNRPDLDGS